jgi:nitronate monooxygenase
MAPVESDATMRGLTERSQAFMAMFGLEYPIIQAPMDGAVTPPLVSAVANAGALGSLPLTWRSPDAATQQIAEVQSQTSRAFLANYVLNFSPASLDSAIEAGVGIIQFSWGLPDAYVVDKLRARDIKMGIQVVDGPSAEQALALGPDFLICQGLEAGGHVQGNKSLMGALAEVLAVAGEVPVAASGGIATGKAVRRVIQAGAAAAVLGTRFVATRESAAHPIYKEELVAAQSADDTVLTVCLNKLWPNAAHRLLRSNTSFRMWESAGRPPGPLAVPLGPLVGNRPGEHDIVAIQQDGIALERYVDVVPVADMRSCDVNALGTFAGEGVGEIRDIPYVAELLRRLAREFNDSAA